MGTRGKFRRRVRENKRWIEMMVTKDKVEGNGGKV